MSGLITSDHSCKTYHKKKKKAALSHMPSSIYCDHFAVYGQITILVRTVTYYRYEELTSRLPPPPHTHTPSKPHPPPGSGIGRLLALRFAALGCRVVLWDMNQAENEKTAHLLRQAALGAQATTYTVDLSNRDQVYRIAGQVRA